MQESKRKELLGSNLKERLDWYTLYASESEYDVKAVESILYLLDTCEPLEEGIVPPKKEAWQRFLEMADKGQELLPVEDCMLSGRPSECSGDSAVEGKAGSCRNMTAKIHGDVRAGEMTADAEKDTEGTGQGSGVGGSVIKGAGELAGTGKPEIITGETINLGTAGSISNMPCALDEKTAQRPVQAPGCLQRKIGRVSVFVSRHKILVAAVLILMILVVGNTVQTIARHDEDFFFWLNRDDSGTQMITSPEGLDAVVKKEEVYYEKKDVPDWAQEWIKIEEEIEMPEEYEWQYYEANELDNRKHIASHYLLENSSQEIVLGVWVYLDKLSLNRERFADYNFIESIEIEQKQMDVYSKIEESGKIYYIVCFYEHNCRYYVRGQDDLEELKTLIEEYSKNI